MFRNALHPINKDLAGQYYTAEKHQIFVGNQKVSKYQIFVGNQKVFNCVAKTK